MFLKDLHNPLVDLILFERQVIFAFFLCCAMISEHPVDQIVELLLDCFIAGLNLGAHFLVIDLIINYWEASQT